jgi:hypothetical protein
MLFGGKYEKRYRKRGKCERKSRKRLRKFEVKRVKLIPKDN